ncbi:MAG: hypothetical protein QXG65_06040, partial [Thermoplasmata archaeon]
LWAVALMMVTTGGVSVVASASIVSHQASSPQSAVVVQAQDLTDVNFAGLNLLSEPYTAAAQESGPQSPVILTGSDQNIIAAGPGGEGFVQGDVGVQLAFNFSANPDAVIGITSLYLYGNASGAQVWQTVTYVELMSGGAPTNFSVSVDLGLAYSLTAVDITMKALPYVDPLPGIPLVAVPQPAAGSSLVVDPIVYVTNDVDSGDYAYWAIDNYTLSFEIWKNPNGTFFYDLSYLGTATTYAGVVSPGAEVLQGGTAGTAYVTYFSGYVAGWVTGTFAPSRPTSGFLGVFDYGGSSANLGTSTTSYSGSPPPNPVNWIGQYFAGTPTYTANPFALVYFYHGQVWIDAANVPAASAGNILVT